MNGLTIKGTRGGLNISQNIEEMMKKDSNKDAINEIEKLERYLTNLKNQGLSDKEIASKLREKGATDEFIVNLIPSLQEKQENSNVVLTKKDRAVIDYLILRIVGVIIGLLLLLYVFLSYFQPQLLIKIVPIGFG